MIKFLLSRFISKDKALEMLEEHEDKITEFSENNQHVATAVKTGFKIWSIWKIILMCWFGFLILLTFVCAYGLYVVINKFL